MLVGVTDTTAKVPVTGVGWLAEAGTAVRAVAAAVAAGGSQRSLRMFCSVHLRFRNWLQTQAETRAGIPGILASEVTGPFWRMSRWSLLPVRPARVVACGLRCV